MIAHCSGKFENWFKTKKKEKLKGGGKFLVLDSAQSGTLHGLNPHARGRVTLTIYSGENSGVL